VLFKNEIKQNEGDRESEPSRGENKKKKKEKL
jgi:hypothetical protein